MADPGKLARDLIQKHFPKFGSIRRLCTYKAIPDPTYDVDTKTVSAVATTAASIYIVFDDIKVKQDDDITTLSIDRLAIFPKQDLSVAPRVGDTIDDDESIVWNVIGLGKDPAGAAHSLHIRPVGPVVIPEPEPGP
jgi:hypothetical protein